MTNLQRIAALSTTDAEHELNELFHHPLKKYINYTIYLTSDDPDLTHALKIIGTAVYRNQTSDQGTNVLILKKQVLYCSVYYSITDPSDMTYIKVPESKLSDIQMSPFA